VINITARADDERKLDHVMILVDGSLVRNQSMSGSYPYPDVVVEADISSWAMSGHNITAVAVDVAGNVAQVSISINVQGFPWVVIPIGGGICALVIVVHVARKRAKKVK
jgi:hypothetical protein